MKIYTRNCEITESVKMPEGMRRIALGVEYCGTEFAGFQAQKFAVETVQGNLERVLSNIANEVVTLVCAGRTDAGVHATGQVVHFDTMADRPERAWRMGVNTQLPDAISVQWAQPVAPEFHARFSAQARTYRYLILNSPSRPGILAGKVTWDRRRLDVGAMQKAAQYLLGEHDFSSFRAAQCQARNPVRKILRLDLARRGDLIAIEVTATAFLHHMVRNIVGVLTAVGAGEKPVDWVPSVLAARDRCKGGVTAPSAGLYLVNVGYPSAFSLPQTKPGPLFLLEPVGAFGAV